MPSDATVAVSQDGLTTLLHGLLPNGPISKSSEVEWELFSASYDVSIAVSGGSIQLNDLAQVIRFLDINVAGHAHAEAACDLGKILPHLCIPPVQICTPGFFGRKFCTPQYCPTWPSVSIPITIPLDINVSADFNLNVVEDGSNFNIVLGVIPSSLVIDATPMAGLILQAVKDYLHPIFAEIPHIISKVIDDLVHTAISAFDDAAKNLAILIRTLLHDLILGSDLLAPSAGITLLSFSKTQVLIPSDGTPANPDVSITLTKLKVNIADGELVATADIA